MLITDHAAREILDTVDRCYVIYQGQVLIDGTPEEVKQHPKVRQEYLGDMDGYSANASSPSASALRSTVTRASVPQPQMDRRGPAQKRSRKAS